MSGTAAVFVNYGHPSTLATALDSLDHVAGVRPDAVVVVDNLSTPANRELVRGLCEQRPAIDLVFLEENLGFGTGMNRGVDRALDRGFDNVLILNSDLEFTDDWFEALTADWDGRSIRSPVIRREAEGAWWWTSGVLHPNLATAKNSADPPPASQFTKTNMATGCALLVSGPVWKSLGGFYERFFMYWEDLDWCRRAAELGTPIEVCNRSQVIHAGGASSGEGGWAAPRMYFFSARNRWLFLERANVSVFWVLVNVAMVVPRTVHLSARARRVGPLGRSIVFNYLRGTAAGIGILLGSRRAHETSSVMGRKGTRGGRRVRPARTRDTPASVIDIVEGGRSDELPLR